MDWFLYDIGLRHERAKLINLIPDFDLKLIPGRIEVN